eukprot:6490871-Amphidinium_carterae.1
MGDSQDGLVDALGTPDAESPNIDLVTRVRIRMARLLSVSPQDQEGLQGWLIQALTAAAGDPDVEVAKWVIEAVPLGASRSINVCGIFPQVPEREEEDLEEVGTQEQIAGNTDAEFANYVSYYENQELADMEFQREVEAGYAKVYPSRAAAERVVGALVPSRVAAVVKRKSGRVKTRLVHDLRRSGVNATLKVPERVVLPRLGDVLEATLDLQGRAAPSEEILALALDFRDAFKQLHVSRDEQRWLSGFLDGRWFHYERLLFGVASGPLLWCRVAAWICRCSQGVVGDKARLHCYVDDPLALLRGTSQQCRRMGASLLVLWSALGLGLATEKGAFGKTVEWIGCELTISKTGAALKIPESKRAELLSMCEEVLSAPQKVRTVEVRRLAGLSSWIAGLITQFKPFVAQLWAALAAEKSTALWRKQVETAVQWMTAFARGRLGPITRIVSLADRTGCGITIAADGSPVGGGAVIWRGPVTPEAMDTTSPTAHMWTAWTAQDAELLEACIGSSASQATFEAFTLLLAIRAWVDFPWHGPIRLIGDAQGVLTVFVKMSSRAAVINAIAREAALVLAPRGSWRLSTSTRVPTGWPMHYQEWQRATRCRVN